jgi:hypothetical protein
MPAGNREDGRGGEGATAVGGPGEIDVAWDEIPLVVGFDGAGSCLQRWVIGREGQMRTPLPSKKRLK